MSWSKLHQLATDPVLRKWAIGRLTRRHASPAPFRERQPPYLDTITRGTRDMPQVRPVAENPAGTISLPLAGMDLTVGPGDLPELFERQFDDLENHLSLHRFAWLPLVRSTISRTWIERLWAAWQEAKGKVRTGWCWHPYTAGERATNILSAARATGAPGLGKELNQALLAHADAIVERLEYFGDHNTSNHLANNGRCLFLIGIHCGEDDLARMGGQILVHEAERIFLGSGVLREDSSHYHLLLTHRYVEAWLWAEAAKRPEAEALRMIAAKALAVLQRMILPGGFPLVGDISPDFPPSFLAGLWTGDAPCLEPLDAGSRAQFQNLHSAADPADAVALAADGWLRFDYGPWSGLWHAPPSGWSHMPGHGHQDIGAAEIHDGNRPLFVDPGRGAYGETGSAALYRSAAMHGTLLINDSDPYPPNKPYYDDRFRRELTGPPPALSTERDSVTLRHWGYARFGGIGAVERQWTFTDGGFTVSDYADGMGRQRISRRFVTPAAARVEGSCVHLELNGRRYRLQGEGEWHQERITHWHAYGRGTPATLLRLDSESRLPWQGSIEVYRLNDNQD